jgi:hypothetical protein
MTELSAWSVAAGLLLQEGKALHYNEITDRILRSQLTDLARRGVTPEQTTGSMLREFRYREQPLFKATGQGYYALVNPRHAEGIDEVRKARRFLQSLPGHPRPTLPPRPVVTDEKKSLHETIARLEAENRSLKECLGEIASLCRDRIENKA